MLSFLIRVANLKQGIPCFKLLLFCLELLELSCCSFNLSFQILCTSLQVTVVEFGTQFMPTASVVVIALILIGSMRAFVLDGSASQREAKARTSASESRPFDAPSTAAVRPGCAISCAALASMAAGVERARYLLCVSAGSV